MSPDHFVYPHGTITKERNILRYPFNKRIASQRPRFPLPLIPILDTYSAFISVAFMLSYDYPYSNPPINGNIFPDFRLS